MPIKIVPGPGTIGRMVHYITTTGKHVLATVLEVNTDGTVTLMTYRPITYRDKIAQDHTAVKKGTWHMPERGE